MRPTTMMARVPTTRARRWRFELGSVPVWGGAAGPVGSRPAMAAVRSVSRLPSDLALVAPELGPSHRAGDEAGGVGSIGPLRAGRGRGRRHRCRIARLPKPPPLDLHQHSPHQHPEGTRYPALSRDQERMGGHRRGTRHWKCRSQQRKSAEADWHVAVKSRLQPTSVREHGTRSAVAASPAAPLPCPLLNLPRARGNGPTTAVAPKSALFNRRMLPSPAVGRGVGGEGCSTVGD